MKVIHIGFKTKIKVKGKPEFSESVIKFQLNRLPEDEYIFTDEWDVGDYRLHLGYLVGLSSTEQYIALNIFIIKPGTNSIVFNPQKYMEKLHEMAIIGDDAIESRIKSAFTRDSPYWNEYTRMTIEYMKAKRDYICGLVNAQIENVTYLHEPFY